MISARQLPRRTFRIVGEIIACSFIFLFVYAATSKLGEYEKFKIQIGQSPLIEKFSWLFSWLVPGMEFAVVLLLIFRRTRLLGTYAFTSMMILFSGYIAYVLSYSSYVPCSCGGILEKFDWTEHLIFNIGFVVLGLCSVIVSEYRLIHQIESQHSIAIGQGKAENLSEQSRR